MIDLGAAMDYYAGFDSEMALHGRELLNAGLMVQEWSQTLESRSPDAASRNPGNPATT